MAGPILKPNRWHPCLSPDDYLRKLKQDMEKVEAEVEAKTRHEPDPDFLPPDDIASCVRDVNDRWLR